MDSVAPLNTLDRQKPFCYFQGMNSHTNIDERALMLARHIVAHIDADPQRQGVEKARATCRRWQNTLPGRERACADEWDRILQQSWENIRRVLLDPGPNATRLRQNSPFCGVLSNPERWRILKEYRNRDARAA